MIRVNDLNKSYGRFAAVKHLTFEVQPGQILGLVGSNGAGKTTTLRTLSGITAPTSGQISLAGYNMVSDGLNAKRRMGYIPDDAKLFDTLTVWEHLAFTAAAYEVPNFESKSEVLMDQFELADKRHAPAQDLSRGMRQKVAIACAYLHDPKVLLFDEPLTGLDPQGIRTIQASLRERANNGVSVIISSHLLSMVQSLCTHLLVLDHGECRWFGEMDRALREIGGHQADPSLETAFFALLGRDQPING